MDLLLQEVIVSERRFQYEAEVKADPQNYDSWFDYARLEESAGDYEKVAHLLHLFPGWKTRYQTAKGPSVAAHGFHTMKEL